MHKAQHKAILDYNITPLDLVASLNSSSTTNHTLVTINHSVVDRFYIRGNENMITVEYKDDEWDDKHLMVTTTNEQSSIVHSLCVQFGGTLIMANGGTYEIEANEPCTNNIEWSMAVRNLLPMVKESCYDRIPDMINIENAPRQPLSKISITRVNTDIETVIFDDGYHVINVSVMNDITLVTGNCGCWVFADNVLNTVFRHTNDLVDSCKVAGGVPIGYDPSLTSAKLLALADEYRQRSNRGVEADHLIVCSNLTGDREEYERTFRKGKYLLDEDDPPLEFSIKPEFLAVVNAIKKIKHEIQNREW